MLSIRAGIREESRHRRQSPNHGAGSERRLHGDTGAVAVLSEPSYSQKSRAGAANGLWLALAERPPLGSTRLRPACFAW
jgi:hypothetical protein